MTEQRRTRTSAVSTAIVMVSTAVSRMLGFVRIAVIGAVFGASGEADVLNLVFNIPNNLRKLLAEGALSSAFVPVLSAGIVEDTTGSAPRELVRRLIGFQLVILVPLLVASTLFAQPVVNLILDFPELERQLLAARLFRWLIHYLLLISIGAVFMGALNAHGEFVVPALSPLWFSVAVIGAVLVFHRSLGVFSMVVGVLVGGIGQVLIQLPAAFKLHYRILPRFDFRDDRFRTVLAQWLPVLSTSSIFTINQQVALFFASALADGSGSAMTNALVFWQLPFGVFGASITTVLFPKMSREWAAGDRIALRKSVYGGLGALALLLIPSAMGLAVLGREMIAVALQRGAFTAENTLLAARVLTGYAPGLFSVAAFSFMQRFYYACGNYRVPLRTATVALAVDVGLSLWLKETVLGVAGLAIANSAAFTVGLGIMIWHARAIIGGEPVVTAGPNDGQDDQTTGRFDARHATKSQLLHALLLAVLASVVAGTVVVALRNALGGVIWWTEGSSMRNVLRLCGFSALGVTTVVSVYRFGGIRPVALLRRGRRGS